MIPEKVRKLTGAPGIRLNSGQPSRPNTGCIECLISLDYCGVCLVGPWISKSVNSICGGGDFKVDSPMLSGKSAICTQNLLFLQDGSTAATDYTSIYISYKKK